MRVRDLIEELKKFDEEDFLIVVTAKSKIRKIFRITRKQEVDTRVVAIELFGNR